jgi:hypothetical protein
MRVPTLIVAGDRDHSPLTTRGPDWFYDPFVLAPGEKTLLTIHGGEHMLGGISGYDVTETTDEDTDRVGLVQEVTLAFLRDELLGDRAGWAAIAAKLKSSTAGAIETKGRQR